MTRRQLLLGAAAWVGCRGRKDPTSPAPIIAPSPLGYSHVLRLGRVEAEQLVAAGLTLAMVEPHNFDSVAGVPGVIEAAPVLRRAGATLIIVGLNWNDPVNRHQPDRWFIERVQHLAANIDPGNVLFEPVSERWVWNSGKATRWIELGHRYWPSARLVETLHPCRIEAAERLIGGGRWVVSDCTPILASRQPKETIQRLARLALQRRSPWLWYDTFGGPWNPAVIEWMKEVLG